MDGALHDSDFLLKFPSVKSAHLIPIKESQLKQLNEWIEEVREHEHSMFKWAEALSKLKESGLWKAKARSWTAFCFDEFGYTKQKASSLVLAAQSVESLRLIPETTGETIDFPTSVDQARRISSRTKATADASPSEKQNNLPSSNSTPVAPAENEIKASDLPMPFRAFAQLVWDTLDWVTHHIDLPLLGQKKVQAVLTQADKFRHPNVLPGMDSIMARKGTVRPTLEDVQLFCSKMGIPISDAEWFLAKMEGNGWMNGNQPVKNWTGTIIQKKNEGLLGSQLAKRQQQQNYGRTTYQSNRGTSGQHPRDANVCPGVTDYGAAARQKQIRDEAEQVAKQVARTGRDAPPATGSAG